MTTNNNFTRPPENQPTIEFTGFMDTDRARMDFDDNFEVIQHSGYYTNAVYYYIDCGNVKGADDIEFTIKGEYKVMRDFVKRESGEFIRSKNDLIEYILDWYSERISLLNLADFNNQLPDGIECITNKPLVKIISRGYSQGDYAEIWYCPDDLEKAWGNKADESNMKKTFDHLLWDCPVYAVATINGAEYNYWDCPECETYTWKREEFINWIVSQSPATKEALEEIIPKDIDYT